MPLFSSSCICVGSCHPVHSPNASKSWSVALILFLTNCFNSNWCISFCTICWSGWGHVRKCWAISLVALHEGHSCFVEVLQTLYQSCNGSPLSMNCAIGALYFNKKVKTKQARMVVTCHTSFSNWPCMTVCYCSG